MRFDAPEINKDEAERAGRSAGPSEVYLRPEAKHDRRLGESKRGRDHLQVRRDVTPRCHPHIVEQFEAALVAHGRD
jgi:hypothetical protein